MAKDEAEALKWYLRAAAQNYPRAQYNLARCYAFGLGVSKDLAEAVKWCRRAAEQNLVGAQYVLGWEALAVRRRMFRSNLTGRVSHDKRKL